MLSVEARESYLKAFEGYLDDYFWDFPDGVVKVERVSARFMEVIRVTFTCGTEAFLGFPREGDVRFVTPEVKYEHGWRLDVLEPEVAARYVMFCSHFMNVDDVFSVPVKETMWDGKHVLVHLVFSDVFTVYEILIEGVHEAYVHFPKFKTVDGMQILKPFVLSRIVWEGLF